MFAEAHISSLGYLCCLGSFAWCWRTNCADATSESPSRGQGLAPDIVILEIRTNDLSKLPPEKVGSTIEDLVRRFQSDFSVRAIGVCYVIPRGTFFPHAMSFWRNSTVLNQYVSVVPADLLNVFCWSHPEFNNIHKDFYLADAVHLNPSRQCLLYRSYRGAVLKAVGLLQKNWPITFTRVFSHVW